MDYKPDGPYVIQSGKHQGKVLELMMFDDYGWLRWFFHKVARASYMQANALHRHLAWLLAQGEMRRAKMLCACCGLKPVEFFSVRWSEGDFSIGTPFTCCGDKECKERIRAMSYEKIPQMLNFRFSALMEFRLRGDRRRVAELFKDVFELPTPLTRNAAFKFFSE